MFYIRLVILCLWYVRIPYMHSALFVRDAIFPRGELESVPDS